MQCGAVSSKFLLSGFEGETSRGTHPAAYLRRARPLEFFKPRANPIIRYQLPCCKLLRRNPAAEISSCTAGAIFCGTVWPPPASLAVTTPQVGPNDMDLSRPGKADQHLCCETRVNPCTGGAVMCCAGLARSPRNLSRVAWPVSTCQSLHQQPDSPRDFADVWPGDVDAWHRNRFLASTGPSEPHLIGNSAFRVKILLACIA